MSRQMLPILFFAMFVWKQECRSIMDKNKQNMGLKSLESIVRKYLGPLQKLTAELPNHAIEMEIEIKDHETPLPTYMGPDRRANTFKNRPPRKAMSSLSSTDTNTDTNSEDVTTPMTTVPKTTTTATTTTSTTTESPAVPTDPRKRPVYMEDLHKALNELEKRLEGKISPQPMPLALNDGTKTTAISRQTHAGTVRNIGDILHLLKKAVLVEKNLPQSQDGNLDWIQLKIPKRMQ